MAITNSQSTQEIIRGITSDVLHEENLLGIQLKGIFALGEERLVEISMDDSIPQRCKDLVSDFAQNYFITAKELLPISTTRRTTRSQSRQLSAISSALLSQSSLPGRLLTPQTSQETSAARQIYIQELAERSATVRVERPVAEATLELSEAEIGQILETRTIAEGDIGCLVATITPNESYAHVNLSKFRNLRRRNGQRYPSGKYYLHHLAALSAHGASMLGTVYNSNDRVPREQMQVSHLCHNSRCVQGVHLVIESSADNIARNQCQNQKTVRFSIGRRQFVFNPCPHRRTTRVRQECILPEKEITAPRKGNRYYYFNETR